MGLQVRLVVYAHSVEQAEDACRAAYARVAQLDRVMSDYLVDSELNRLCRAPAGTSVKVSEELFTVLQKAQSIAEKSGGAFDVTVGPIVQIWRKARKTGQRPDEQDLQAAQARVGHRLITLNEQDRTVTLAAEGMRLDLGGIAKGYVGDEAIRVLREHGIRSALFEAGGDVVVSDPPPNADGWSVRIVSVSPEEKHRVVTIRNTAVSTSGDTEQFVVIDGQRYSHVVDSRTGMGLTTRRTATVYAPRGLLSDPLATTLTVLDDARREMFMRTHFPDCRYIVRIAKDDPTAPPPARQNLPDRP